MIERINPYSIKFIIGGIVQGVGFRPFVYRTARKLKLTGTVNNANDGVIIYIQGSQKQINAFSQILLNDPPPLSQITDVEKIELEESYQWNEFKIISTKDGMINGAIIPPDISLCHDCLQEFNDFDNRRYNYPFINCTNCGPRFSIIEKIPYDRAYTSMKTFKMCEDCNAEYINPDDRRFHAQPNACSRCGPSINWHAHTGTKISCSNPVEQLVKAINNDKIVGIKGLGGFHLCVNAMSESAISMLRKRKARESKPLAIMVAGNKTLNELFYISKKERQILFSPEHPILLLSPKHPNKLSSLLSPNIDKIGVMLPYTPLHQLIFKNPSCPEALVMTSGNKSGEPICISNDDALNKLKGITDFFLFHNREIITRVDDSVTTTSPDGNAMVLRRSRGYAPRPIVLPWKLPSILACGAQFKNTFCLAKGNKAYLSQHIGNLENSMIMDLYQESLAHLENVFEIKPDIVACDLHPDYISSHFAKSLNIPLYKIQHHHAHAVSVMADNKLSTPVLAIVMDGTGYGDDGTIWGGEILLADPIKYKRLAHLQYSPLPGGEKALYEPWRMAYAALLEINGTDKLKNNNSLGIFANIPSEKIEIIHKMLNNNFNSPLTSSCGRLFDTAASLLGLRNFTTYEAQSAMELESLARKAIKTSWTDKIDLISIEKMSVSINTTNNIWQLNSLELLENILVTISQNISKEQIAFQFHLQLISSIAYSVYKLSKINNINNIVVAGGSMQNSILLEGLFTALRLYNLKIYTGRNIPINDGGISMGQIVTGGLLHVSGNTNAHN